MSRVEEGGVQKLFVPIPDVDRGRADFRSIKAVSCYGGGGRGLWELGTETGILSQMYLFEKAIKAKVLTELSTLIPTLNDNQ